jgi:hypothetical protein
LIYRNWNECRKFRREHGLGPHLAEVQFENMNVALMGRMAFDFMLVDTDLTPGWEAELNRRQCRHVIPVTRLRYRVLDAITARLQALVDRMHESLTPARCRRVPVLK